MSENASAESTMEAAPRGSDEGRITVEPTGAKLLGTMSAWIDVTVPLSARVPTFPGDPRFELTFAHRIEEGKPYNVGCMKGGVHSSTHVDAPFHFIAGAPKVDFLPVASLIGPARVVEVGNAPAVDAAIVAAKVPAGTERVLFRSRMSGTLLDREFDPAFTYIAPDAARALAERGIRLVGIDYLSIEQFGSSDFPSHHALLSTGAVVLEGLDLSLAVEGAYDLICAPALIEGGDGAPARVFLRPA
jgi:arylformamidase